MIDATDLEIEISDFDAAVDRLRNTGSDADEARRAIMEALNHLYTLEAQLADRGYWKRVGAEPDGQTCAGLTVLRAERCATSFAVTSGWCWCAVQICLRVPI